MLLNGNVQWVIRMVIMDSDIKMTRLTMMVMMMMMILTMMMGIGGHDVTSVLQKRSYGDACVSVNVLKVFLI